MSGPKIIAPYQMVDTIEETGVTCIWDAVVGKYYYYKTFDDFWIDYYEYNEDRIGLLGENEVTISSKTMKKIKEKISAQK